PANLTIADAKNKQSTGAERPLNDAGRLPIESRITPPVGTTSANPDTSGDLTVMIEEPVGKPIPSSNDAIEPLPSAIVERFNLPRIEEEVPLEEEEMPAMASSGSTMNLNDAVTVAL